MDYINKAHKRKTSKQKQAYSAKTKLIAAAVIISIAVVVTALNIYNSSTTEQTALTTPETSTNQSDDFVIPNQPAPEYVYPTTLTQDKESTTGKGYDVPDASPHIVRCGAFKKERDAQNLKNKISKFTPMKVTRSGSWFVVTSSVLANKRDAENLKNQIKTKVKVYECVLRKKR